MIGRLRRKLIAACILSLAAVLLIILGGVNLMSYRKVVSDADAILTLLGANGGVFPKPTGQPEAQDADGRDPNSPRDILERNGMSLETPYESRFFSVLFDQNGQALQTDTGQIAAVDADSAIAYAKRVVDSARASGFWGQYRYLCCTESTGQRVIFLDCSRPLSNVQATLFWSISLSVLGLAAVWALLLLVSGHIIRPVAESYEKQRRFITDAGHELKTPLTVIGADVDLAEMECGENQWLSDIRRQTQRLAGLTNDLIYLSRMEEEQPRLQRIEFPLSDLVEEMTHSFLAPARQQDKELSTEIQPMLSFTGDEKAIRQLISILLDNALKYSPAGGRLRVTLKKQGRCVVLAVSNTSSRTIEPDTLPHLFDRFYRADPSRDRQTGGYGLGLSIAQSITAAHKGKIQAQSPDGATLFITVTLPA